MFDKSRISVKNLIELVKRSGDIDNRRTSEHTAYEGARIHRLLQSQSADNYQSEVYLAYQTTMNGLPFQVDGRADGLIREEDQVMIDEIKTSQTPFDLVDERVLNMYWYQAMCYAFIIAEKEQLSNVKVQLTYYQTTEQEVTRTIKNFTFEELETFFNELLAEYSKWHKFVIDWNKERNESLDKLTFPFPTYRKGQKELSTVVYKCIMKHKNLYVEAPTGVGKTISTLFPSLKAMAKLNTDKIFYLTAKTITRTVALNAIEMFKDQNLALKSIIISAKDKVCFQEERDCNPQSCKYASDYYDKLNTVLFDILLNNNTITTAIIEEYALKYEVCPFELSLDLALFVDLIICDYNYLFDPHVKLKRFFETKNNNFTFLIDEAHNLVDRSRSMYTETLDYNMLLGVIDYFSIDKKLSKSLQVVLDTITNLSDKQPVEIDNYPLPFSDLNNFLFEFSEYLGLWLLNNQEHTHLQDVLEVYFMTLRYLKISELYNEAFTTILDKQNNNIILKQYCMDPNNILHDLLEYGKSTIFFSATLTPFTYYKNILGGNDNELQYHIQSPFEQDKQKIIIHERIKTTYAQRNNSKQEIINTLTNYVNDKKGNYMFFFPSYKYMNDIYDDFNVEGYNIIIQLNNMSEQEREAYLDEFKNSNNTIGFCVMGGIFSEGIDLKGDHLIGAAIISVGLPMLNYEQNLIKDYYDQKNGMGFMYAYQIPGMNKVIQSAGRVIRDVEDKGSILLLDQRFNNDQYACLMPKHWNHRLIATNNNQIRNELREFWK